MAATRPRVTQALIGLGRRWPKAGFDAEQVKSYASDLEDLCQMDESNVLLAIDEMRKFSRFLPTVGEIREKAIELMGRDLWVLEAAAWGEVEDAVRRYGVDRKTVVLRVIDGKEYGVVEEFGGFSSPIIEAAVRSIGWEAICNESERGVIRGQFRKAIEQIQERTKYELVSGRAMAPDPNRMMGPGNRREMRGIGDVMAGMLGPGKGTSDEQSEPAHPHPRHDRSQAARETGEF